MTAQKRFQDRLPAPPAGRRGRGWEAASQAAFAAALLGCVLPAVGCKTGSSFAKPSWWTFGGTPKDADSLAAAPPYGGDIRKPSEAAKPYPTTSTPSGYVITGTGSPTGAAAPPQFQAAQTPSPVVYGSTPAPQSAPAAIAAAPSSAMPQQPGGSPIAAQVGPYAPLAGDAIPPPGQPLPPIPPSSTPSQSSGGGMASMSAMPAMPSMPGSPSMPSESTLPNAAYSNFSAQSAGQPTSPAAIEPPPARMADSRLADPAAALPAAAMPPVAGGSRYSSSTGSRFSGAEAASFPPPSAAQVSPYGTPSSATSFSSPSAPSPAGLPAATPAAPGLLQPAAQPSTQPVRRPDPVYRPGGTSSYRPSRALLADDNAPTPSAVRTAAYDEPLGGTIQQ